MELNGIELGIAILSVTILRVRLFNLDFGVWWGLVRAKW